MFIWGNGHRSLQFTLEKPKRCEHCGLEGERLLVIEYDYSHIFWVFKGLKNKVSTLICLRCTADEQLDKAGERAAFAELGRNPIPFMDRYGAVVLVAIIAAWMAFAFTFPCTV